jgi:hypothetical protein
MCLGDAIMRCAAAAAHTEEVVSSPGEIGLHLNKSHAAKACVRKV